MKKKLTKHGNSLALVLDKPLLRLLKIDEKTVLEIVIEDNLLKIRPIIAKKEKSNDEKFEKIAGQILKHYNSVFKKLAKT